MNIGSKQDEDKAKESFEEIVAPYKYILQCTGKNVRTKLIVALNKWLNVPEDKIKIICDITETLHNASLIIDDIEDNSNLRRGIPTAHLVYGVPLTINAGNYVYFLVLDMILKQLCHGSDAIDLVEGSKIYCNQLLELHRGQGMDIYFRDNHVCPTEPQYLDMIDKKTGGLFGLAIKLMQLYSNNKTPDYLNLIKKIGLYFQIRDDLINLISTEYQQGKGFAEDLSEGKFSFPLVHAIKSFPNDSQLLEIVRKRPEDVETKKVAIKLMEEFGSFKYTASVLQKLDKEIKSEVKRLGDNSSLTAILDLLAIPQL